MAGSGIAVKDECLQEYKKIKEKGTKEFSGEPAKRCIFFKISDDKKFIEVDKVHLKDPELSQEDQFGKIMEDLDKQKIARYIVWDLECITKTGQPVDKLLFMMWCPDDLNVKIKMLMSSSKDAIKKKLVIASTFDCSEIGDAKYEDVCKAALGSK